MKVSAIVISFVSCLVASSTLAFTIPTVCHRMSTTTSSTQRNMFGGGGAGVPSEDNPEELAKMEQAAKAMGMSLDEYKLGMNARVRLTNELDAARVTAGKTNIVTVERDGNNPPKYFNIVITEDGKKLGTSALSTELVSALKMASESSRTKRTDAQKNMMSYIGDEMKKLGA